jgi:diguanylate cyclase (GGDEF)-like protein
LNPLKNTILKLNRLILALALTATILTLFNSFYSNYQVQKEQLILQSLESNMAYASKLSDTTEMFLRSSQQQLAFTANALSEQMSNSVRLNQEANRLKYQTDSFNSVVISNELGITKAASPEALNLVGVKLNSVGTTEALYEKKALISAPYISSINNLVVFMSEPIVGRDGDYLGFLGGTIYLKNLNILSEILGDHYYENGSYIYVVDKEKKILYHPNISRIGTTVINNDGLDKMLTQKEGGMQLINSQGITMLAGYSTIASTGWIVVTQSPLQATLEPLFGIMQKVLLRTLPVACAVFLFIWFFARSISRPLQQLADKATTLNSPTVSREIESINSWYVESHGLKQAMLIGVQLLQNQIGELKRDAETDPLTGASNRRALQLTLKQQIYIGRAFSVLALDIDFFKRVNDTYGHKVGDDVLKQLTKVMTHFSKAGDMVSRTGGEEFVILLKNERLEMALALAEQLRTAVANEPFELVGNITVSIGIAHWSPEKPQTIETLLALADQALYKAKEQGRNRCVIANDLS